MSFAIAVRIDAWGNVSVEVTDQAGGCPFAVAHRDGKGGKDLEAIPRASAALKIAHSLTWSPHAPEWSEGDVGGAILAAVCQLALCLPPPEAFDEDGRRCNRKGGSG